MEEMAERTIERIQMWFMGRGIGVSGAKVCRSVTSVSHGLGNNQRTRKEFLRLPEWRRLGYFLLAHRLA